MTRWTSCLLLATACWVTAPATAWAQPSDSALADSLFEQARDLMKEEKWAEACPKLGESNRLDPKLGTLLNLAVCHERAGNIATAYSEFKSLATLAEREGQDKRTAYAKERIAALEKKLAHVVIAVAVPKGITVTLDGKAVTAAAFGVPLALDPGKHEIAATATGKKRWSKAIEVPAEKTQIQVEIPELEDDVAEPAPPPEPDRTAPEPPPPAPKPAPVPEGGTDLGWLAWTGFAVGGAGLIVGAVTGGLSLSDSSEILDQCDDEARCPRSLEDDISQAQLLANVSNAGFVIGAVGVAVGIVALVVSNGNEDGTASGDAGARLELRITTTGAQLRGAF